MLGVPDLACSASTRPLAVLSASAAKSGPPAPVPADLPCTLCDSTEGVDSMLICDRCERGFHLHYPVPPRSLPPFGSFLCPSCDPEFNNQSGELYNSKTPMVYRPQDPFADKSLMRYLHLKVLPQDITQAVARLLKSRARRYRVHPRRPSFLQRYTSRAQGWITLPPLEYRLDLIRVVHDATGHSGARTTAQHLSRLFTWPDLHEDCYKFASFATTANSTQT